MKPKRLIHRTDAEGGEALLHMPMGVRVVSLPEPVDAGWVGWRRAEPWEAGLIVLARHRERRLELAMFAGLIGQPVWTRVRWDEALREWRVVCPVHGELAHYRNFWVASRDARQHNDTCPGEEEEA